MEELATYLTQFLSTLAAYTGSYGTAIICLAVIVRLLMLPITALQSRWNQRASVIEPALQNIARKSPTRDAQRLQAEAQVYQKAGIGRGTGCFWLVVVAAISIGVWYALYSAIPDMPGMQAPYLWMPSLALPNSWSLPAAGYAYYVTPVLLLVLSLIHMRMPLARRVGWNPWPLAALALFVPSALGLFWLATSVFDLIVSFMVPHAGFWFSAFAGVLAAAAGYAWSGSPYVALVLGWFAFTLISPRLLGVLKGPHKGAQTALYLLPHLVLGPLFLWLALPEQAALAAAVPLDWTTNLAWLPPITPLALAFLAAAAALWLSELLLMGLARLMMPASALRAHMGQAQARGQTEKARELSGQLQDLYDKRTARQLDRLEAQQRRQPKQTLPRVALLVAKLEAQHPSKVRDALLARASALHGDLQQALGYSSGAIIPSYLRAWRLGRQDVAAGLAPLLAAAANADDEAINIYLHYLRLQPNKPDSAQTQLVLKALQAACHIADDAATANVATRMARLEHVLAAAPGTAWAHYEEGAGFVRQAQWQRARASLEKARQLDAKHWPTRLLLAKVYLQLGQLDQAEQELAETLRLNTGQAEANYLLGKTKLDRVLRQPYMARHGVYVAHGALQSRGEDEQVDEAARRLEQAVGLDGSKPEYLHQLGLAHWVRARRDKALAAFERAAAAGDRSKECQYYLAAAHMALAPGDQGQQPEHCRRARSALQRALAADPEFVAANRLFAELLVAEGDYKQAAANYRRVVEQGKADATVHLGLGRCLFELGEYQAAIEELQPVAPELSPAYYWKARAQLKLARYMEAVESLESYHARSTVSAESLYYLGCAYAATGAAENLDGRGAKTYLDEAINTLARCLALQADYWPAYLQSGHIHLYRNEMIQARRHYLQANVYQPQNVAVLHALGKTSLLDGSENQARAYFERALKLEPGHKPTLLALGLLAERAGDLAAAREVYMETKAYTNLGVLYCKTGDYTQAHEYLNRAAAASAAEDARLYYLGYACAQTGRYAEALRAWTDLSKRHPEDASLGESITHLYKVAGANHAAKLRYAEAAEAWEEYLRRRPNDGAAAAQLAQVYLALAGAARSQEPGASKTAVRALQRAVSLTHGESGCVYALALAELQSGDFKASAGHLQKLLADAPGDARYRFHLALALAGQGQAISAHDLLEQVAESADQPALAQMAPLIKVAAHAQAQEWNQAAVLIQSWLAVRSGRHATKES